MQNLNEKHHSNFEQFWIYLFQVIGLILFIAPLFLPTKAYFFESKENVVISFKDVTMAVVGIFLARGGKSVGVVINNIGIIISDTLKRLANFK